MKGYSVARLFTGVCFLTTIVAGAAGSLGAGPQVSALTLSSPAFERGATIPAAYTCDGPNLSPALQWRGAPARTRSFVLIMDDPDTPFGTFTHWVLFNIPGTRAELPEGLRPGQIGTPGTSDFGRFAYGGPCPPSGTHRYFFTLFALDLPSLPLKEGASRKEVEGAMQEHVLGQAQLMGRYRRR